ncbi:hypothetical protein GTV15_19000 [Streptomyces sp. SID7803]|nr:hypothetical protein [Streptomyces sp. SID7803]
MQPPKPPAFIVFSDLSKIGPSLIELRKRGGLAVLAISQKQGSAMVQKGIELLGTPGRPVLRHHRRQSA